MDKRKGLSFEIVLVLVVIAALFSLLFLFPGTITGFASFTETSFNGTSQYSIKFNYTNSTLIHVKLPKEAIISNASVDLLGKLLDIDYGDKRITNQSEGDYRPQADFDSERNIHLTWVSNRTGDNTIFYKKLDSAGNNLTGDIQVVSNSGWNQVSYTKVDSENNVHIVWASNVTNPGGDIYHRKLNNIGNFLTGINNISDNTSQSNYPTFGIDSDDNLHVVWYDSRIHGGNFWDIFYRKLDSSGEALTLPIPITNHFLQSDRPIIKTDLEDNSHIIWFDNRHGNNEIYYIKINKSGANITGEIRVTEHLGSRENPYMAIDENSQLHLGWVDDRDFPNTEIYYKKLDSVGQNITGDVRLTNITSVKQDVYLSSNGQNKVFITWRDSRNVFPDIYYRIISSCGTILDEELRLTMSEGHSFRPIVLAELSRVHFFWDDNRDGNYEIYYRQLFSTYPLNVSLDVGNDGSDDYQGAGYLTTADSFSGSALINPLQSALDSGCACAGCMDDGENCTIPINISFSLGGELLLENLSIGYFIDETPPSFSSPSGPANPSTYTASANYLFKITVNDDVSVDNALLELNGINYSATKSGDEYSRTFTGLAEGDYSYKWHANDTSGKWSTSALYSFTIKAPVSSPSGSSQYSGSFYNANKCGEWSECIKGAKTRECFQYIPSNGQIVAEWTEIEECESGIAGVIEALASKEPENPNAPEANEEAKRPITQSPAGQGMLHMPGVEFLKNDWMYFVAIAFVLFLLWVILLIMHKKNKKGPNEGIVPDKIRGGLNEQKRLKRAEKEKLLKGDEIEHSRGEAGKIKKIPETESIRSLKRGIRQIKKGLREL